MLKVEEFIEIIKLDNLVDAYKDELDYPPFRDWRSTIVMVRKELAEKLIDDNYVINEMVKFIDDYIRQVVELGIVILLEDIHKGFETKSIKTKALTPEDYIIFDRIFNQELSTFAIHNEPRLWGILGVGYGQGVNVGLGDLGIPAHETDWQLFRETAAYRQLAFQNLQHISNNLGHHIKGVVAAGVTEGVNPYEISRRLREIKLKPKRVTVPPKIVNGKEVRTGYQYLIPQKRYAEMIARTESSRAINQGRLDAYRRTGIKQVEFLGAGDNRVCEECMDYDGNKYPIDNAPLIPIHVACLIEPKTLVYTVNGWVKIKNIKKGDLVLTHKGKFKKVKKTLEHLKYKGKVYEIFYGWKRDNYGVPKHKISFTSEHPVLTERGWIKVQDLTLQDKIIFLAKRCKQCNKLFPVFSEKENEFCSHSCINKYTALKQWENPKNREMVSKKVSEWNIQRYKDNPELKYLVTKNALKKCKELYAKGIHPVQINNTGKTYEEIYGKERGEKIAKKIRVGVSKNEYQKNGTWSKGLTKETNNILKQKGIKQKEFYKEYPDKHPNRIMAKATMKGTKGYISIPQKKMYSVIKNIYEDAELEYPIKLKKGVKFADVGIPSLKLDCEYDGEYWHQGHELDDKKRDIAVGKVGWDTIRFNKNNYKDCIESIKRLEKNHNGEYEFIAIPVLDIKKKQLKIVKRLYNFSVEEDESYIVKGMVSHNCRCTYIVSGKITDEGRRDAKEGIKLDSDELPILNNI